MYGVRHNIREEFHHLSDALLTLKAQSREFARMLSEYDETDKRIYGLEISCRPVADSYISDLKKRRLQLKDRIYQTLAFST